MPGSVLEYVDAADLETKPPDIPPDTQTLADEAQELLGYNGLQTAVKELVKPQERELLGILREHGIQLFRPADVEEYKQRMVTEAKAKAIRRRHVSAQVILASLALVGLTTGLSIGGAISGWFIGAALLLLALAGCFFAGFSSDVNRTIAAWSRINLKGYSGKVPAEVLALATGLKKKAPNVDFMVEELRIEKLPFDPFLIVTLGEASLAIAVWAEPRFHAPPID